MLQELTNKIKKIIPEIEELKFGCKIEYCDRKWQELLDHKEIYKGKIACIIDKYSQKDFGEYQNKIIIIGDDNIWEITGNKNIYKGFKDGSLELLEIIGRDITLEDVLRCLGKALNSSYQIRDTGEILIMGIPSDIYWALGKPLHEQSEETIKELNKII